MRSAGPTPRSAQERFEAKPPERSSSKSLFHKHSDFRIGGKFQEWMQKAERDAFKRKLKLFCDPQIYSTAPSFVRKGREGSVPLRKPGIATARPRDLPGSQKWKRPSANAV
jgi:hypothetical protein